MVSHMDAQQLEQFFPHILTPAYCIIEKDMIRYTAMEYVHRLLPDSHRLTIFSCYFGYIYVMTDELKTTTTELVDLVQAKVGTTNFAAVYNQVRQSALNVR